MTLDKTQMEILLREIVDKFLIPKFQNLGMYASGKWVSSLAVDFDGKSGFINGEDYTKYLVEGRPHNNLQTEDAINHFSKWAGHYIFKEWCRNKGISEKYAYAIARKVAEQGTSYYPKGTDLLEVLTSDEVTNYFNLRVSDMIVINTKIEFERIFKEALQ